MTKQKSILVKNCLFSTLNKFSKSEKKILSFDLKFLL